MCTVYINMPRQKLIFLKYVINYISFISFTDCVCVWLANKRLIVDNSDGDKNFD